MMLIATLLVFLGLWRSFAAAKVLRILDGKVVENNKYPFVVMTKFEMEGKGPVRGCSGSLIAAQWVLTAAHCVMPGTYTHSAFVGNETSSFRKALKGFSHPYYQAISSGSNKKVVGTFIKNDIGLILIEKFEGVKLARVSGMDYKSLSGLPVAFAGFGNINNDYEDSFVMRPFQIGKAVVVHCNPTKKYGVTPGICVAPKCNTLTTIRWGDSGGPVMFGDTIIGVASSSGETPVIGAFCPVSPYLEWINMVMTTHQ